MASKNKTKQGGDLAGHPEYPQHFLDSLKREDTCFVICPIGEDGSDIRRNSDKVFQHIIKPAAEANNLTALRSDHIGLPGMITHQIIQHILDDAMVVADLTDHNANVFYELALRHAFRKPIVQLISQGQKIPFDVQSFRTIPYTLDLDPVAQARETVTRHIAAALGKDFVPESPVTFTATLEALKSTGPTETLLRGILDQVDSLDKALADVTSKILKPHDLMENVPAYIRDSMDKMLQRYAREIELLQSVRQAGVIGLYRRRESAIKAFARYLDEEPREIMVVGSSLKGLLQKEEYKEIAEKLRFKLEKGLVKVRFMLTHPIVADFRASQENRRSAEIGMEIISSLETLKSWKVDCANVRLYLGTPTCFAIKTTRQMLVNPYPYMSVSYESPCLILEYSPDAGAERPSYFFEEFSARHFGAWDTDLAVHISDYDSVISHCKSKLDEYSKTVEQLLASGKSLKPN